MATQSQMAAFAFNAYRPRGSNFLDVAGWDIDADLSRSDRGAGFDGSVFYAGNSFAPTEIVISFRGTDGFPSIDWPLGNLPAAAGYDWGR